MVFVDIGCCAPKLDAITERSIWHEVFSAKVCNMNTIEPKLDVKIQCSQLVLRDGSAPVYVTANRLIRHIRSVVRVSRRSEDRSRDTPQKAATTQRVDASACSFSTPYYSPSRLYLYLDQSDHNLHKRQCPNVRINTTRQCSIPRTIRPQDSPRIGQSHTVTRRASHHRRERHYQRASEQSKFPLCVQKREHNLIENRTHTSQSATRLR